GPTFMQGDIAISSKRSAIACPGNTCLWPKSVDGHVYIPYILSPQYNDFDRIIIETGMQDISTGTCVRFVPRTHEANYLDIQPKFGCWSYLGLNGGAQQLSLQTPGCMWSGVASHELMHALGFVHEQSRSDRDEYVTIMWENILKDREHNFDKYETNNLNAPYDYGSIMHYGKYAFSEDGAPTIIPKPDPNILIGQRDGPSTTDLMKINRLYDCGQAGPQQSLCLHYLRAPIHNPHAALQASIMRLSRCDADHQCTGDTLPIADSPSLCCPSQFPSPPWVLLALT
ncbi:HCE1 enzyme, partial [Polypterus senegalus]